MKKENSISIQIDSRTGRRSPKLGRLLFISLDLCDDFKLLKQRMPFPSLDRQILKIRRSKEIQISSPSLPQIRRSKEKCRALPRLSHSVAEISSQSFCLQSRRDSFSSPSLSQSHPSSSPYRFPLMCSKFFFFFLPFSFLSPPILGFCYILFAKA